MSRRLVLVVSEDDLPDRLDHFLGANAPELSSTRAKEIIATGSGDAERRGCQAVGEGRSRRRHRGRSAGAPALNADPEDIPLDVVYEDDDVIVVDKPAGMVVHPAPGSMSGTLVNALLGRGRGALGRRRLPEARHRPPARPRHVRA